MGLRCKVQIKAYFSALVYDFEAGKTYTATQTIPQIHKTASFNIIPFTNMPYNNLKEATVINIAPITATAPFKKHITTFLTLKI